MNSVDWKIYDENEICSIPKNVDLLLTVEHKGTKERKVIISHCILHKISPSAPGRYSWIPPKGYFWNDYDIIAWAPNVLPYKDNCWDEIGEAEFRCSDCRAVWTSNNISKFEHCPSCGELKKEVRSQL